MYDTLFLIADDVPGLDARESVHHETPEERDEAFVPCGGIKAGFNAWQRLDGEFQRFVDIRWLFDSEAGARRYHRLQMQKNSEGMHLAKETTSIGAGTRVFTGTDPFNLGVNMYLYIFTVGQVVAKLFFANISEAERARITTLAAERIVKSLESGPLPDRKPSIPVETSERWPRGKLEYEDKLAGQQLLPGTGLGDVLTFSHTIVDMYQTIGGGEEDMSQPFVYFFTEGAFAIAVCGRFSRENDRFDIVKVRYWDDPFGSLKTPGGRSIGSDLADVKQEMGTPASEENGWMYYPGIAFKIGESDRVEKIDLVPLENV